MTSPARQNFSTNRPRLRCLSDEHGLVALGQAAPAKRRCLNLFNCLRGCGTDEEGPARRPATRHDQFVCWSSLFGQRRATSGGRRGTANSQCSATGAGSSATVSGTTLTPVLRVTFSGASARNRVVYAAGRDGASANSGWHVLGVRPAPVTSPSVSPLQSPRRAQRVLLGLRVAHQYALRSNRLRSRPAAGRSAGQRP